MKMIVGGAFQGKMEFACNMLNMDRADMVNGSICDFEEAFNATVIMNYHRLVARLFAEGVDPVAFTEKLCEKNRDVVVIMDEIGCGIVPVEKSERTLREITGRCGCIIASVSDTVIHMVCGIPTYLKGEPNED